MKKQIEEKTDYTKKKGIFRSPWANYLVEYGQDSEGQLYIDDSHA